MLVRIEFVEEALREDAIDRRSSAVVLHFQPSYCISWGPRQIKLSMIHEYWPKIHDGEKLTDMEAFEVVNSNDASRRFFLDCAIHVTRCAKRWVSFANRQTEGQVYIDLIRAAKGI